MSCAHCGKPGAVKGCSACKTTRYCDEDCQRAHWALHKGPCKETQRAAAFASTAPSPLPPPAGPFVLDLHCGHCGAELAYDVGNKRCGACNRVGYCGKACQKAHWAVHKEACGAATRARVHAGEGELEGAEGTLKRAMEKAQREQGEESVEALGCMNTYAVFLKQVARFEEAVTQIRKVLEVCRRTLGDSHPNTLTSINNLALLLRKQGKLGEAEPLYREALDGQRRTLGDSHPDTLTSIGNLALLLKAQGKLGEAEPLYREALDGSRRTLGDSHPSTLTSISNLAAILLNQGKLAEAGPLLRESLDGHRRVLGDAHPNTRNALRYWELFGKARAAAGKRK